MSAWRNPIVEWWRRHFGGPVRTDVRPNVRLPHAPEDDDLIEIMWRASVQKRIERERIRRLVR